MKGKNYTVDIKWDYDQLLNVIWKRLLAPGDESRVVRNLFKDFESEINDQYEDSPGRIPGLKEESNKKILNKLPGTYMGSNNKAFLYNWIKYHTGDKRQTISYSRYLSYRNEIAEKRARSA